MLDNRLRQTEELPVVSVVLPIRNEAENIEECLGRLLSQDYPPELVEIIVVDGNSTDGTRDAVLAVQGRTDGGRIRLLDNPKRIVPAALNIGISAAEGDVIVRMDGHTVPEAGYLSACVRALRESQAANVGGPMIPVGKTRFGEAVAAAQQHPIGVGDAKFHFDGQAAFVDTVYMGAFRKEIFALAGLFDESMVRNQDSEMNIRIRKAGGRIYLDPAIRSSYTPRGSWPELWRQYFQYGWWRVETVRRHPGSLRWRQLIPALFVVGLGTLAAAALFVPLARIGLVLFAGTYLTALLATTVSLREKLSVGAMLRVPAALATMHVGWGSGFLLSLFSKGSFPYTASPPEVPVLSSGRSRSAAEATGN